MQRLTVALYGTITPFGFPVDPLVNRMIIKESRWFVISENSESEVLLQKIRLLVVQRFGYPKISFTKAVEVTENSAVTSAC